MRTFRDVVLGTWKYDLTTLYKQTNQQINVGNKHLETNFIRKRNRRSLSIRKK